LVCLIIYKIGLKLQNKVYIYLVNLSNSYP